MPVEPKETLLSSTSSKINTYLVVNLVGWTIVVTGLLVWDIMQHKQTLRQIAIAEARANFNKDLAFRLWSTSHGGVYVPISEDTPPNPYLSHVPERDIDSPSGKKLTLMNPAYMLRQMNEFFSNEFGIAGHITSLNPLRPENGPDDWERQALKAFEQGKDEVLSFVDIEGEPFLRLMQPMIAEEKCLKCHGHQGYQVGDIRGGIGISLPMKGYLANQRESRLSSYTSMGILWLLGSTGLLWGGMRLSRRSRERDIAVIHLQKAHDQALSDQKQKLHLEKKLHQSQKLESIGRLAGGVAHDFNNMLGVILGHTELVLGELKPTDWTYESVLEIQTAATRSAKLTQQLLAFARKQPIKPELLDLNSALESIVTLVRRLIGENIELVWKPGETQGPIRIDPIQLDQIVANLCLNARDAISEIGTITVRTSALPKEHPKRSEFSELETGEFICLCVQDDGSGMEPETLKNIFEPFFTTKAIGEGSGLGLATVYGIVRQNGAVMDVQTELGVGTTFSMYFPVCAETDSATKKPNTTPPSGGNETILLVEDEPSLLHLIRAMLQKLGYSVISTSKPTKALEILEQADQPVTLVISDVVMPNMSGVQLYGEIQKHYPDLPCLFISGYTAKERALKGVLNGQSNFLHKPFTIRELAEKIRATIPD